MAVYIEKGAVSVSSRNISSSVYSSHSEERYQIDVVSR